MDPLIIIILLILLLGGASAATKSSPASSTSYQTERYGRIDGLNFEEMDPRDLRDQVIAELQAYLEDNPRAKDGYSHNRPDQIHFALNGVDVIESFTNGYVSEATTNDWVVKAVDQESRVITESFRNPESIKDLGPEYIRILQYFVKWESLISYDSKIKHVLGLLEYNEYIREPYEAYNYKSRHVSNGISFVAYELSRRMGTAVTTLKPADSWNEMIAP